MNKPLTHHTPLPGPLGFLTAPPARGKLGWAKAGCAVFGGLATAYSGMTLLACLIPAVPGEAMLVSFVFTPLAWSLAGLWISLAPTRKSALMRALLPALGFTLGIIFFNLQA